MKVASISSCNYLSKTAVMPKKNQKVQQELNLQNNDISFKGKKWAILEGVAGALLGFVVAGPVGAVIGAGAGAGIGSTMDDDMPHDENGPEVYTP